MNAEVFCIGFVDRGIFGGSRGVFVQQRPAVGHARPRGQCIDRDMFRAGVGNRRHCGIGQRRQLQMIELERRRFHAARTSVFFGGNRFECRFSRIGRIGLHLYADRRTEMTVVQRRQIFVAAEAKSGTGGGLVFKREIARCQQGFEFSGQIFRWLARWVHLRLFGMRQCRPGRIERRRLHDPCRIFVVCGRHGRFVCARFQFVYFRFVYFRFVYFRLVWLFCLGRGQRCRGKIRGGFSGNSGLQRLAVDYLDSARMLGPRRIEIAHFQHLDREMTSPAGAIPAAQVAAGLGVVEHDARMIAVDNLIQTIQRVIGGIVQIHHQHLGTDGFQQLSREAGHAAFVHDARAALVQRIAQVSTELHVIEQQRNRRCGPTHDSAPTRCSSTSLICTSSSASW